MSTQPFTSAEEAARTLFDMAGILRPAAIRAAATLRLADHITAGTTSAGELAELTSADPYHLTRLLRYLAALGVLDRGDGDHYSLTELGEPLRSDGSPSIRAMLDTDGFFGRADLGMLDLTHTMRTGRPSHEKVFGTDFWSDVQRDPTYAESFEAVLGSGVAWDAELIIDSYPWSSVHHVTDVGGSTGSLLIELLRKYEHLNGRVVDLPNAVAAARRRLVEEGLDGRGEAVEASFFDRIPTGSDLYMLSAILADWTDEKARLILRKVAEAAGPNGRVLLSEVNLPEAGAESEDSASTASDLYIAAAVTTPARTTSELVRIAEAAELRLSWRGPASAVRSVLEFTVVP